MAGSVNKAFITGRIGGDPETRSFQNGGMVCNFSVATSENWKDKATGEKKERTQWHKICIFNEPLAKFAGEYAKKGDLVHIEGQIETRKYEKDGKDVYTTEIVVRPYKGEFAILASNTPKAGTTSAASASSGGTASSSPTGRNDMDDEIPF